MIAYFASDLIWATRIKATAQDLGLEARPVRTVDMLMARLADSPVRALVVDLDAPGTALELIRAFRAHENAANPGVSRPQPARLRVLAFGPHVEVSDLREASSAGADLVLARGAFHHNLPRLLQDLDAPAS